MKAAQLPEITLRRGLHWHGRKLTCYADTALAIPSVLTGWTPVMQVREQPGGAVVWTFDVSLAGNVVTMAPRTGAQNAALQVGLYRTQLSFLDGDGLPVGPFAECAVVVKDEISIPTA